jgi:hypothetical protein
VRKIQRRTVARAAVAIALVAIGGVLAPRLLARAQTAAAAVTCRLPLVVDDNRPGVDSTTAGFVSLPAGKFSPDPSQPQPAGLPFMRFYDDERARPLWYDVTLRRWLPALRTQISPDQRSYLYVVFSPLASRRAKGSSRYNSSTLFVYDVANSTNRVLWTYGGAIDADWEADGIHAETTPVDGGGATYWIVDPATGARATTSVVPASSPISVDISQYGGPGDGIGPVGVDFLGRPVMAEGSRSPGQHMEYFIGEPGGWRVPIHSGIMGDADDFDPTGFVADGDQLWAANSDGTALWRWTEHDGLHRYPLGGVTRISRYTVPVVAGTCS